ncbi:MAG TPA: hypothetical protein VNF73_12995 [Candidatus Saccharimonadales bacterium]|nr:hypothetical protein [Candidatus Saccharimonadales bacterium]
MADLRTTGVWISADSARIVQWSPDSTLRHRIDSGVPGRHRATGHAPTQHHGQGDGRRDEQMRAFFDRVSHALSLDDDLLLIGDGEVVGHFADQVRTDDAKHGRKRRIETVESSPLTERQLIARIRAFAGHPAVRRRAGADAGV